MENNHCLLCPAIPPPGIDPHTMMGEKGEWYSNGICKDGEEKRFFLCPKHTGYNSTKKAFEWAWSN